MRDGRRALLLAVVSVVTPLLVWEWMARAGALNPILLPAPSAIFQTLWSLLASGAVLSPLFHTLGLLAAGFSIASVLAVALGTLMGSSPAAMQLFEPLVELVRPIPKPALVPPLFLFLGIGTSTMVVIVALVAFFPILIHTIQGVKGVDPVLYNTGRTFRMPRLTILRSIVLPSSLPMILTGMRVSLALALALVILAEMIAGDSGVGYLILDMQRSFRIREMYAWVLLLAVVGFTLNALFEWAEARAVSWRGK